MCARRIFSTAVITSSSGSRIRVWSCAPGCSSGRGDKKRPACPPPQMARRPPVKPGRRCRKRLFGGGEDGLPGSRGVLRASHNFRSQLRDQRRALSFRNFLLITGGNIRPEQGLLGIRFHADAALIHVRERSCRFSVALVGSLSAPCIRLNVVLLLAARSTGNHQREVVLGGRD